MPAQLGKIYVAPGGAQRIVTKGGPGTLGDGDTALALEDGDGARGREAPAVERLTGDALHP